MTNVVLIDVAVNGGVENALMLVDEKRTETDGVAGLFALEAETRDAAVMQFAAWGEAAVPLLMPVVVRPLNSALARWPEWPEMLPASAIMARCATARAAAVQGLVAIGSPAVCTLTELLQGQDAELRLVAAQALAEIGDSQSVTVLRRMLGSEMQAGRWQRTQWRKRRIGTLAVLFSALLLTRLMYPMALALVWYVGIGAGALLCVIIGRRDRSAGLRLTAATALAKAGRTCHIGLFTTCLKDPAPTVRRIAARALTQLLPQMCNEDRDAITTEERNALARLLDGDDPALSVAVLTAMQQVGDERILSRVAFLIDSPVHDASVRSAAKECLPQLKMRVKETKEAQALLRPSFTCAVVSEELLRPARENDPSKAAEQLLRPR